MEIKGKVHEIGKVDQVSETFKKQDLIIEYAENPTYPEYVRFEALQDKTGLLNNLKVGDDVEVFFNLRGRPWTDKAGKTSYFNSLVVWRISVIASTAAAAPTYAAPANVSNAQDNDDDLPF